MQVCLLKQQCKAVRAVQLSYFTKDCLNKLVCKGCISKHLSFTTFTRSDFEGISFLAHIVEVQWVTRH